MGIDDLLGADDVIVLESYGMDTKTSSMTNTVSYWFSGFTKPPLLTAY